MGWEGDACRPPRVVARESYCAARLCPPLVRSSFSLLPLGPNESTTERRDRAAVFRQAGSTLRSASRPVRPNATAGGSGRTPQTRPKAKGSMREPFGIRWSDPLADASPVGRRRHQNRLGVKPPQHDAQPPARVGVIRFQRSMRSRQPGPAGGQATAARGCDKHRRNLFTSFPILFRGSLRT